MTNLMEFAQLSCVLAWSPDLSVFPCRPMSPSLFLFRICPSLIPALAHYWVPTSPASGLLPLLIRPQVCTEMCLILSVLHDFPQTLEMGNGDSLPSPLTSSHTPLRPLPALPSTCCGTLSKSLHDLSFQVNCQVPASLPPTPSPHHHWRGCRPWLPLVSSCHVSPGRSLLPAEAQGSFKKC